MKNTQFPLLAFFFILSSIAATAFPCNKYVLDLGTDAMPGNIVISWSINNGFNNCGFNKEEVRKHRFLVTIKSIFEDVLFSKTIEQNYVSVNTQLVESLLVIVSIAEFDDQEKVYTWSVNIRREGLPPMTSKIDSLNSYLLHGYFPNALSILHDMKRTDMIDDVIAQHKILFPDNYPDGKRYFNCYLDSETSELAKMPYVAGLSSVVDAINKETKNEPKRSTGFNVYATVTGDNKLAEYVVIPAADREKFEKVAHLLTFDNRTKEASPVIIMLGRTKNEKMFTIINERALMDPESKSFKKTFPRKVYAVD